MEDGLDRVEVERSVLASECVLSSSTANELNRQKKCLD